MVDTNAALAALFARRDPHVRAIYDQLIAFLDEIGPYTAELHDTSIALQRTVTFVEIDLRKSGLILNLRLDRPIANDRILQSEPISRMRFHNETRIDSFEEVDRELTGWLREAYDLA